MNTVKFFSENYEFLWIKKNIENPILYSDKLRMYIAKNYPHLIYVDCDVELKNKLVFEKNDKPYFGKFRNRPDYFLFYVNGFTDFFIKLEEESIDNYPKRNWIFNKLKNCNVNFIKDNLCFSCIIG